MTFTLGAPQIIMILLYLIVLGVNAVHHNEQNENKYNFWTALCSACVNMAILWWGGFFG